MKRYIQSNAAISPLRKEAQRVFNALERHDEVINLTYVEDTDSYCIKMDPDATDISWIWQDMKDLGYSATSEDEEAIEWAKGKDFRAWCYEEPELELYISR